jgi:hypothetical protein
MEVAIESSLPRRTGPHSHGIDDRFVGHFWATGNDSNFKPEVVQEDQPDSRIKVNVADSNLAVERYFMEGVSKLPKESRRASERDHGPRLRPWKGPLPAPRKSPKVTISDIVAQAHVRFEQDRPELETVRTVVAHRS